MALANFCGVCATAEHQQQLSLHGLYITTCWHRTGGSATHTAYIIIHSSSDCLSVTTTHTAVVAVHHLSTATFTCLKIQSSWLILSNIFKCVHPTWNCWSEYVFKNLHLWQMPDSMRDTQPVTELTCWFAIRFGCPWLAEAVCEPPKMSASRSPPWPPPPPPVCGTSAS